MKHKLKYLNLIYTPVCKNNKIEYIIISKHIVSPEEISAIPDLIIYSAVVYQTKYCGDIPMVVLIDQKKFPKEFADLKRLNIF